MTFTVFVTIPESHGHAHLPYKLRFTIIMINLVKRQDPKGYFSQNPAEDEGCIRTRYNHVYPILLYLSDITTRQAEEGTGYLLEM